MRKKKQNYLTVKWITEPLEGMSDEEYQKQELKNNNDNKNINRRDTVFCG